jgi:hypothetical protein
MASRKFLVDLTPILFHALIESRQFQECCKLLQELRYSTKRANDVHALSWYFALCIDLILDTENDSIIEYDACRRHYLDKLSFPNDDSYSEAYARFLASFWLWNLRIENVDMGRLLILKVLGYYKAVGSLCNVFTGIRIVEGLNHQLWNSIRLRNGTEYCNLIDMACFFVQRLKKLAKSHSCFSQRLKLCEIQFNAIRRMRLESCRRRHHQLVYLRKKAIKRKDYYTADRAEKLISHYQKSKRACLSV